MPQLSRAAKTVEPGLYAVFEGDVVYLGSAPPVNKAVETVAAIIEEQANITTGRGHLLIEIEKTVNELRPLNYMYLVTIQFPALTRPRRDGFSVENLARGAINDIVASLLQFGNKIGLSGATNLITYNAASGLLSTRVFDSTIGLSRQISSALDDFGKGRKGSRGLVGSTHFPGTDSFGRGVGDGTKGTSGERANSAGSRPLGGGRGQAAMDDRAPDSMAGEIHNGTYWDIAPGGEFGYPVKDGVISDTPDCYAPKETPGHSSGGDLGEMSPLVIWGTPDDAGIPTTTPDDAGTPDDEEDKADAGIDQPPEAEGGAIYPVNPEFTGGGGFISGGLPGYSLGFFGVLTRAGGYTNPNPEDMGGAVPITDDGTGTAPGDGIHIIPGVELWNRRLARYRERSFSIRPSPNHACTLSMHVAFQ
jgi:hypothetical protein